MTEYILNLVINNSDLFALETAKLKITIARLVDGEASAVWIAFDPLANNTVRWSDDVGIYVSVSDKLQVNSSLPPPVQSGKTYQIDETHVFRGIDDPNFYEMGAYKIKNEIPDTEYPLLIFGLTQSAAVNNTLMQSKIINMDYVPAHMWSVFHPSKSVSVWLEKASCGGRPIDNAISNAVQVDFGPGVSQQTLKFDKSRGMFVFA